VQSYNFYSCDLLFKWSYECVVGYFVLFCKKVYTDDYKWLPMFVYTQRLSVEVYRLSIISYVWISWLFIYTIDLLFGLIKTNAVRFVLTSPTCRR